MKRYLKLCLIILVAGFIIYLIIPFKKPLIKADYSLIVKDQKGKTLRVFLNSNEQWFFPPEDSIKIPEKLKTAVLAFEDIYFFWHPGVNPVSVFRAARQNISKNKVVSGASTITMQIARIRGHRKRTFFNKLLEMVQAFKIELHYSKNEILKIYLDNAPYGSNIIGFKAASARYFQKQPFQLSWAEAALLAVLPNAPGMVSPVSNKSVLKKKRDKLLFKLYLKKVITQETYKLATLENLPYREFPFENTALHLTQRIFNSHPAEKIINTTIDFNLQWAAENIIRIQSSGLRQQGIMNVAAVIIETQTGKTKAYIGSQDFFDSKNQGQVDGVIAPRSSGSLFKPFLYALSIDEGIIIPQTLMMDVPTYFNAFSPNNSDEKFSGVVTAKEALVRSLNVPAVRLLNSYGVPRFYSFLKKSGISTLFRPAEDYGLPLIIGGAEVTLWDMAALFRGLGNNGNFCPTYYLKTDSQKYVKDAVKLISPGACYLTLEMLKELKRPGAEYYWDQYQNQKPIAWKTGTSYGFKDAWAVGVSPQWTIAVWVGNFTGEPNSGISGASSAGPLMFTLFNYLPHNPALKWFENEPMEFKDIIICRETGFLAGSYCDNKDTVEAPMYMLPLRLCPFHKNVFVDKSEDYEVCSFCWKPGYHEKHFLVFPASVNYQLKLRGQLPDDVPSHNPLCTKKSEINPLQFIYPVDSAKLWVPRDFDGNLQRIVAKVAHNKTGKLIFWYLDDDYLGTSTDRHTKALEITQGWHKLMVVDADGNSDKISFYARVSRKK